MHLSLFCFCKGRPLLLDTPDADCVGNADAIYDARADHRQIADFSDREVFSRHPLAIQFEMGIKGLHIVQNL